MKKVYILISTMIVEYTQVIHGVYSTLESAEKERERLLEKERYFEAEIEESLFYE